MRFSICGLSLAILIFDPQLVRADLISDEKMQSIAKLCDNDTACENQQLKTFTAYKKTQAHRPTTPSTQLSPTASGQQAAASDTSKSSAKSPMLPTLSADFPFPPNCDPANQALFVRSDSLDNFNYVDQLSTKTSDASSSNGD